MGVQHGKGIFLSDEIMQSGDPTKHAADIIATMQREGLHWVAQQILPGQAWEKAVSDLRIAALQRPHGAVGTWAQGLPAADEVAAVRSVRDRFGITFHIPNIESAHENAVWTDTLLAELVGLRLKDGYGVIFTEGAWGRSKTLADRWRLSGFAAIPEAIVSENAQAKISAMLELSQALGWDAYDTNVCVYLTRGAKASVYNGEIGLTGGRYSIFRYGDIDADDWQTMKAWPATQTNPNPTPTPIPTPPPALRTGAQVAADIFALLSEKVSDGGFTTADTLSLIDKTAVRWEDRQAWLTPPNPVVGHQRIQVAKRSVKAPDASWKVAGPQVDAIYDSLGL